MATETEQLVVQLEARMRDFERNFARASRVASDNWNRIEQRSRSAANRMERDMRRASSNVVAQMQTMGSGVNRALRTIGLGLGLAQISRSIGNIVSEAGELAKTADLVGVTTDAIQELAYAAGLADVPASDLNRAMEQFARRIGEASRGAGEFLPILEAHNIALTDEAGNVRDTIDLFNDFADAIHLAGSEQEAIDLAAKAFGESGTAMVTMLRDGSAGLATMRQEARDTGAVIDGDLLRNAERVNDEFTRFSTTVETAFKSAVLDVVSGMAEGGNGLQNFAEKLADIIRLIGENFDLVSRFMGILVGLRIGGTFGPIGAAIGAGLGALAPELLDIATANDEAEAAAREHEAALIDLHAAVDDAAGKSVSYISARIAEAEADLQAAEAALQLAYARAQAFAQAVANEGLSQVPGAEDAVADADRAIERVVEIQQAIADLQVQKMFSTYFGPTEPDPEPEAPLSSGGGVTRPTYPPRGGGGGGGGGGVSRDAVAETIAALEDERAALMLSNRELAVREALSRAGIEADDERAAAVIEAATALYDESAAIDAMNAKLDTFQSIASSAVKSFVADLREGKSAAEAFGNVVSNIASQLLSLAVDRLFSVVVGGLGAGGVGGGGILSRLLGFASGGPVHGPGTGTSDSILARLSAGEFVINAKSTERYRPLLEAINDNRVPALARGGAVERIASGGAPQLRFEVTNNITVDGGTGGPDGNAELAKSIGKEVETSMRRIVGSELLVQMRPGGILSHR